MATLTQIKRDAFSLRYERKDARTLVYRAVYGPLVNMATKERDDRYCTYQNARDVWASYIGLADFPFWKEQDIEARIELLKRRPQGEH